MIELAMPRVMRAERHHLAGWRALRATLWADTPASEHATETAALLTSRDSVAFIAEIGCPVGFAEASLRREYVNGCDTSPVVYLEGIYVRPAWRLRGVARALCEAVADWGRARGCTEFASDALLANADSHAAHRALGFQETERVVCFRRLLK